jgi:signal transduction histidine kinase
MVRVSVADKGIGVKPSEASKLFERFYRVETDTTRTISGFGIGLYLSSEIIALHNGRIWVDSGPGLGSVFYFELPLPLP